MQAHFFKNSTHLIISFISEFLAYHYYGDWLEKSTCLLYLWIVECRPLIIFVDIQKWDKCEPVRHQFDNVDLYMWLPIILLCILGWTLNVILQAGYLWLLNDLFLENIDFHSYI